MANAKERFGNEWGWTLEEDAEGKPTKRLGIGEAITGEGPGQGHTIFPWAMDRYERALRLRPGPAWLLKRLLKHAWEFKAPVFVSLHGLTKEAMVTRRGVQNWMRQLEELGYAVPMDAAEEKPAGSGRHYEKARRYDVSGFFSALALCIAGDPESKWAKANGGPLPPARLRNRTHTGPGESKVRFNLDFDALYALSGKKPPEEKKPPEKKPARKPRGVKFPPPPGQDY